MDPREGSDPPIIATAATGARRSASEPPSLDRLGDRSLRFCEGDNGGNSNNTNNTNNNQSASTPAVQSVPSSSQSTTIDASAPQSISKAQPVRGHRRRSTHVTRRDLEKFRREVLGIDDHWYEEENGPPTTSLTTPFDPEFENLNRAFASAAMSLNCGNGGGPGPGAFSNYVDSPTNTPRQPMSPAMSHAGSGQVNGGGMPGMNGSMPMNAGHQMDLHHLYEMVLELSEVLKNNREVTKSIVTGAEEVMVRAGLSV